MRTHFLHFFFLLGILGCMYGCSPEESVGNMDFILDNNISKEKWNGTGFPSWLNDRYSNFMRNETEWLTESFYVPMLCKVYKFSYKENLLLALTYNRFSLKDQQYYHELGTICYTDDGRRVKFENVKNDFAKNAELIWSNEFDDDVPQIADFGIEDTTSLGWLQKIINNICADIKEPDQLLYQITCGYVYDDSETYIAVFYRYFDKKDLDNGEIIVRNTYTLDGEQKDIEPKEINLLTLKITDLWDEGFQYNGNRQ